MVNTFNRNDGTFSQVDYASVTGTSVVTASLTSVTNATTADIALTSGSTTTFVDGPVVTLTSTGTWFLSGTVTFNNSVTALALAKLWDGTTVLSASADRLTSVFTSISLSGVVTTTSSAFKISASSNSTSMVLEANPTGANLGCTLTAVKIA